VTENSESHLADSKILNNDGLVQISGLLSLDRESLESGERSLQEIYAPNGRCFGCGPANPRGLRIQSYVRDDAVVADWKPEPYHEAFEGCVNGGIIGVLFDCHSNWAATYGLMKRRGLSTAPGTVTAEYCVTHLSPTPSNSTLHFVSKVVELSDNKAVVETTLEAAGKVTARFKGTFVAVREGHPAYGRWR
jgi:acyl-coenzyme A thioesterase PaaI-like protein